MVKSVSHMMVAVLAMTKATAMSATVIASRCTARDSRLPNTFTAVSPRTSVTMMKKSTANVVILMPPAVPAGPPPMNIKMSITNQLVESIAAISMLLNPAVLVCTDWVKAARMRPGTSNPPSVRGLFHSSTAIATVPARRSTIVPAITSLVFMLHRRGVRKCLRSAMITGKPKPPMMMAAQIGRMMNASLAYGMRL